METTQHQISLLEAVRTAYELGYAHGAEGLPIDREKYVWRLLAYLEVPSRTRLRSMQEHALEESLKGSWSLD